MDAIFEALQDGLAPAGYRLVQYPHTDRNGEVREPTCSVYWPDRDTRFNPGRELVTNIMVRGSQLIVGGSHKAFELQDPDLVLRVLDAVQRLRIR